MEIDEIKKRVLEDVDPVLRKQKRKQNMISYLIVLGQFLALIIVVVVIFHILMGLSTVDGNSMYPTLHNKEVVVYQKKVMEYQVGDIVVIRRPSGQDYVKRVVAVAGDVVNIQDGRIYVNGKAQTMDGAIGDTNRVNAEIPNPCIVGDDQIFVLGDNRENSEDSRSFGPVSLSDVKGKLKYYIGGLSTTR